MKNMKVLKGLKAEHFIHPGDRIAIEKLRGYPTFKRFMERLLVEGLEEDMYLLSLADNVKLGRRQGNKIYNMGIAASKILDMVTPEIFMDTDPIPNAYAFGEKRPIITVSSGLIDTFSDHEIFAVLGHELGHIKCNHTLYSLMAQNVLFMMQIFQAIPFVGTALGIGFYLTLLAWHRRSELSADRAALLVSQSKELVTRTMMKLAGGGSNKIYQTLSSEAFLEQANEYEKLQEAMIDSGGYKKWAYIFGTFWAGAFRTHPWPALRTKEVIRFCEGERYENIISGDYPDMEEKAEGIFSSEGLSVDTDPKGLKEEIKDIEEDLKEKATGYGKRVSTYFREKITKTAEEMREDNKDQRSD